MSLPLIVDNFCDFAGELRAAVDAHFADPYAMNMQEHGVWNYWHVPGKYTYLRSAPPRILGAALSERFFALLRQWSLRHTGLVPVSPLLSLYVAGCHQALHNDAPNGRLGFVYSLTNWQQRKFDGGETLLLRENASMPASADAPAGRAELFDIVEPLFNRLLLFDDRRPHGVAAVAGPMDPLQGRIVMHGHLVEAGVQLLDGKPSPALRQAIDRTLAMVQALAGRYDGLQGIATFRVDIAKDAATPAVLLELIGGAPDKAQAVVKEIVKLLAGIDAKDAPPCALIVPVSFGAKPRNAS